MYLFIAGEADRQGLEHWGKTQSSFRKYDLARGQVASGHNVSG
jgi:hypothetical protein